MMRQRPYTIIYARGVNRHREALAAKYDRLIQETIKEQLQFEPNVETSNRKPLRQPAAFGAGWEIRFGPDKRFRVLYDVDQEQRRVEVLAIGEKQGNRLIVAGEEVEL